MAFVVLGGCSPDRIMAPAAGLGHAAWWYTCAPDDALSVAIILAAEPVTTVPPTPPYVELVVWQSFYDLGHTAFSSTATRADMARRVTSHQPFSAEYGGAVIRVKTVDLEETLGGNVDVEIPSLGRVRGGFVARRLDHSPMCG